jgi:hypothetical protein
LGNNNSDGNYAQLLTPGTYTGDNVDGGGEQRAMTHDELWIGFNEVHMARYQHGKYFAL